MGEGLMDDIGVGAEVREYRLTATGRKQLQAALNEYRWTSRGIALVLVNA